MRVIVNIPLHASLECWGDVKEDELPNVGDRFDDTYVIIKKTIIDDTCVLDTRKQPICYECNKYVPDDEEGPPICYYWHGHCTFWESWDDESGN